MTDLKNRLTQAGWIRRGAFWSPPGSRAKFSLRGAESRLARDTTTGPRPDQAWKKAAIVDWLTAAQVDFDPGATKAELLETAAAIR